MKTNLINDKGINLLTTIDKRLTDVNKFDKITIDNKSYQVAYKEFIIEEGQFIELNISML
jgi:hypothetical protein